jgi:hypothetical protein
MTSGQDVSEYLDTLGLVKSYFFKFFFYSKIKKIENFFLWCSADAQRMRRFACFQDCLLTLTCHLAEWTTLIIVYKWLLKLIHSYTHRHLFRGISVLHFRPRLDHHSVKMGPRPRHRFLILSLEHVHIAMFVSTAFVSVPADPTCVPSSPPSSVLWALRLLFIMKE